MILVIICLIVRTSQSAGVQMMLMLMLVVDHHVVRVSRVKFVAILLLAFEVRGELGTCVGDLSASCLKQDHVQIR